MATSARLRILRQPDDTTCGPTCLHAVYRYWGEDHELEQVIREVVPLETRGTLAVLLACHALRRGYRATIYTYNLHVFDPSWFREEGVDLAECLRAQSRVKRDRKLRFATRAYLDFLSLGGELRFRELTPDLVRGYLKRGRPILTGLSATYLYGCPRERESSEGSGRMVYDDVRGHPTGHFVVLSEYDPATREVVVADPLGENPRFGSHYYRVGIQRVLGAILLGVLTYDANFLVIEPASEEEGRPG
jgi:hypothetical protein